MATYNFETLAVQHNSEEPLVLEVALNRPEKLNTLNDRFWLDMKHCMEIASSDPDVHCVLIHGGACRLFSAGLDLNGGIGGGHTKESVGAGEQKQLKRAKPDVSRVALRMEPGIIQAQDGISSIERCRKPVVVALHNGVIGGGIDIACACDIRYCTEDTYFVIAEVNIGIAADVGTLQRLPKIVGNDSIVRELALTGRKFLATEAQTLGLIGTIFPDRERCLAGARATAKQIATKSPVGVIGTKASLNYSRDHTVQEGLEHVRLWNSLHLQSEDVKTAVFATLKKTKALYSRL